LLRLVTRGCYGSAWRFSPTHGFQAGENEIIGPASTDDYKIELKKYLTFRIFEIAPESLGKIENLLFTGFAMTRFLPQVADSLIGELLRECEEDDGHRKTESPRQF
jgi:hypothetical protein